MKLKYLVPMVLLVNVSYVHAAELRGNLTGIRGASVEVNCAGWKVSTGVSDSGSFNISNIPPSDTCNFVVKKGSAVSASIAFDAKKNNINSFNGSLKKVGNRILVILN